MAWSYSLDATAQEERRVPREWKPGQRRNDRVRRPVKTDYWDADWDVEDAAISPAPIRPVATTNSCQVIDIGKVALNAQEQPNAAGADAVTGRSPRSEPKKRSLTCSSKAMFQIDRSPWKAFRDVQSPVDRVYPWAESYASKRSQFAEHVRTQLDNLDAADPAENEDQCFCGEGHAEESPLANHAVALALHGTRKQAALAINSPRTLDVRAEHDGSDVVRAEISPSRGACHGHTGVRPADATSPRQCGIEDSAVFSQLFQYNEMYEKRSPRSPHIRRAL